MQAAANEARNEKHRSEAQSALKAAAAAAAEKQKALKERARRDLEDEAAQKVLSLLHLYLSKQDKASLQIEYSLSRYSGGDEETAERADKSGYPTAEG